MELAVILVAFVLDFIITIFLYLLVPMIFCIRQKPMTEKQIKKVVFINGSIVWLGCRIISIEINGEPGTGAAVFLWSAVAYFIMKKVLLKDEKNNTDIFECKFCGYKRNTQFDFCPQCGKSIKQCDLVTTELSQAVSLNEPKISYCRKCGSVLLEHAQFCSQCGAIVITDNNKFTT